jgi:hypothetical protein
MLILLRQAYLSVDCSVSQRARVATVKMNVLTVTSAEKVI